MPEQARFSTPGPGLIAAGTCLVAFLALMLIGGYGFFAVLFLALVLGIAVAAFFLVAERGDAKSVWGQASWTPPPASGPSQVEQVGEPAAAPVPHEPARGAPKAGPGREAGGGEPAGLEVPRDGGPDDLKRIKGIGPKLEAELNRRGIFHLDQIASWSDAEVAWMDENLVEFPGRVSRDDWVRQARQLAESGKARRLDDGGVYH